MPKHPEAPMLPGFETAWQEPARRAPQPRNISHDVLQPRELRYRAFNLPFRAQLEYNITQIQSRERFFVSEVLTPEQELFLKLCTTPDRSGHYLTEAEIKAQVTGDAKVGDFRKQLYFITVRIWRRWANGRDALELLKPEYYLYRRMMRAGLTTISQLRSVPAEQLVKICPNRNSLHEFTGIMRTKYPDYQPPDVQYRDEKHPYENSPFV